MPSRAFTRVRDEDGVGLCRAEEGEQDSKIKVQAWTAASQGRKTYLLLQIGHLLHSFHSSWKRLKFKEEIL